MTHRKVLLGVDPFAEEKNWLEKEVAAVDAAFRDETISIEPIYVVDPKVATWAAGVDPDEVRRYEISIRDAIQRRLAKTAVSRKRMLPPVVIVAPSPGTRGQVAGLLEHAESAKSDFIAVCSHSRKGLNRLFLGSFAETLSLRTDVPVLVVNPRQRLTQRKFRSVLFPTDLSPESKRGLHELCSKMRGQWKKIVLLHQLETYAYFRVNALGALPYVASGIEDEWLRREVELQHWTNELRAKGFDASYRIHRSLAAVADAIQSAAKAYRVDTIAVVSRISPFASGFLGGTARKVIRESSVPVWVVHVPGEAREGEARRAKTEAA